MNRLIRVLEAAAALVRRRPLPIALACAVVLALPVLGLPFMMDDFIHLEVLRAWTGTAPDSWGARAMHVDPLGLINPFAFMDGTPAQNLPLIDQSIYPWWTLPDVRLNFWRPLSTATMLADGALFGRWAVGYHLHSIAWFLGLIAVCHRLFRRLLGPGLAALALLVFTLDSSHTWPVGWIANRNALVAAVPALLGLVAHLRWREQGWRPGLPLSVLGLGAGLLGGEAALGVFGYLGAYELVGARGSWWERVRSLVPAGLVGLAWAAWYKSQGFGAMGSGLYLDPIAETGEYALQALQRLPALIGAQFGLLPSDVWAIAPPARPLLTIQGVAVLVVLLLLLRLAWPTLDTEERRALRWLSLGGALALLPVIATFPLDRLLLLPGIAGAALIAVVLRWAWSLTTDPDRPSRLAPGLLAAGVGGVHLVLAPLAFVGTVLFLGHALGNGDRLMETIEIDWDLAPDQHVLILNASDPGISVYLGAALFWSGRPVTLTWTALWMVASDHRITRTGEHSFELEALDGRLLDLPFPSLFRGEQHPFAIGDRVEVDLHTVEVLAVEGPSPTHVAFTFHVPLDDPSLVFLVYEDQAVRRYTFPDVGDIDLLTWEPGPSGL